MVVLVNKFQGVAEDSLIKVFVGGQLALSNYIVAESLHVVEELHFESYFADVTEEVMEAVATSLLLLGTDKPKDVEVVSQGFILKRCCLVEFHI